jgi:phenylacetate-CoA ligase
VSVGAKLIEGRGRLRSGKSEIAFPTMAEGFDAIQIALQFQLEDSEWWSEQRLRDHQRGQARILLAHARRTVPYYRERETYRPTPGSATTTDNGWRDLPILTRAQIQAAGKALHSDSVPKLHGQVRPVATSGSTGRPIRALDTGTTMIFFRAFNLRKFLWHDLDFSAKVAAIRKAPPKLGRLPNGSMEPVWTSAYHTGPSVLLDIGATVEEQLDWLMRQEPAYLLSHPTNLEALALRASARNLDMSWLRAVYGFGEPLDQSTRDILRANWKVPVWNDYSAVEIGMIGVQCPEHDHLHVMAESVLVEVLDDDGRPCAVGETGRVVLTPLHNFAYPLIRYEIGDYASLGGPCDCGRGLPVLTHVQGRQRNMLVLPGGDRRWPVFRRIEGLGLAGQYQLVQRDLDRIEAFVVPNRALDDADRAQLVKAVRSDIGFPIDVVLSVVEDIPRARSGKFENFRSEVP